MIPDSMNPRQMAENILELQRQIKEAGSELPTPEAGDVGKILKVGSEGYELATEYSYTPPAYSSTDEVNTGQKWFDGKDIYSKVISGTFPTITQATDVELGSISGIDTLVNTWLVVKRTNDEVIDLSNYAVRLNSNTFSLGSVNTPYSQSEYNLTLFYTKSAPTPDVVPAPDNDTRSASEPIEEVTEEPLQETKTTRKRSTSSK